MTDRPADHRASAIVFWRHGRTAWNADGRLQGQSDIELDETGHQQISAAAQALATTFPSATIITSDLKRAHRTAAELSDLTGQQPIIDTRLRERSFGEWEGLSRDVIAERWPELFAAWHSGTDAVAKPPGGESRQEVGLRVAEAVREHAAQVPEGEVLLVVSHGAAITAAITTLIGEDAGLWHGITGLDNANWSVLVPARSTPNWRIVGHNMGAAALSVGEVFGA